MYHKAFGNENPLTLADERQYDKTKSLFLLFERPHWIFVSRNGQEVLIITNFFYKYFVELNHDYKTLGNLYLKKESLQTD